MSRMRLPLNNQDLLLFYNHLLALVKEVCLLQLRIRLKHRDRACCFVCGTSNIWDLVFHHMSYQEFWDRIKDEIIGNSITYKKYRATKRKWSPTDILSQIEDKGKRIEYHIHLLFEIITNPTNFLVLCNKHHIEMEKFFISKNNFNISSKQIKKNCERKIQQINEKSKNKIKKRSFL